MAEKRKKRPPVQMPNNQKSGEMALLERRKTVADLYCQGKTQWEIAVAVGVAQTTVSDDIKAIRDEWLALAATDVEARILREVAKLDYIEQVAWDAFFRSVGETQVRTEEVEQALQAVRDENEEAAQAQGGKGKRKSYAAKLAPVRKVEKVVTKVQVGDERFLARAQSCVETRLKLLGALKPDQHTTNIINVNWDELTTKAAGGEEPDPVQERIDAERRPQITNGKNGHA